MTTRPDPPTRRQRIDVLASDLMPDQQKWWEMNRLIVESIKKP